MSEIGKHALEFLEAFRESPMYKDHHYRSLSGIKDLSRRYGKEAVDKACRRACLYGSISYNSVKRSVKKGYTNSHWMTHSGLIYITQAAYGALANTWKLRDCG